jgi:hypothetical protein
MKTIFELGMNISYQDIYSNTINTYFDSRELAEAVLEKTKKVNENSNMDIEYTIREIKLYENEQELPIMNSIK